MKKYKKPAIYIMAIESEVMQGSGPGSGYLEHLVSR